jgi:hypothetical protein
MFKEPYQPWEWYQYIWLPVSTDEGFVSSVNSSASDFSATNPL